MAGERTLPGLGLRGYWTPGSNLWNEQHDPDTRLLSVVTQLSVVSRTVALPGSPTDGMIYIVVSTDPTNPNRVAARDNGAWVYIVPQNGWVAYVQDEQRHYLFNGTSWIPMIARPEPVTRVTDTAASRVVSNADLVGQRVILMDRPTDQNVIVNTGLTGLEPVIFVQIGAGRLTFGGSATLQSRDNQLRTTGQFSAVTLIPRGSDTYILAGDLTT